MPDESAKVPDSSFLTSPRNKASALPRRDDLDSLLSDYPLRARTETRPALGHVTSPSGALLGQCSSTLLQTTQGTPARPLAKSYTAALCNNTVVYKLCGASVIHISPWRLPY